MEEDKLLYLYKDEVKVPILTMVDDALAISECGYKTNMLNSFINTKTNIKKLQYGVKKCFKMHVGKTCVKEICPDLHVDGWKVVEVTEVTTGEKILDDEYTGAHKMEEVDNEKYLGDILSSDGKNCKNIAARKNRGFGVITQIMSILTDICFGRHYFEVAIILRNSLLISSLLTNSEAWYNLTIADIKELESVDEIMLRKILECPSSTPKEMLYLELGVLPIRYIIMMRRLNFLQYILYEDKNSLIHSFLKTQLKKPTSKDWGQTVLSDIKALNLKLTIYDIENLPITSFKTLVKDAVNVEALKYLNKEKKNHSKVAHIVHKKLEMENYLKPCETSTNEGKFLFILRTRMLELKGNFRNKYSDVICPCCKLEEDLQEHLVTCISLILMELL